MFDNDGLNYHVIRDETGGDSEIIISPSMNDNCKNVCMCPA